MNPLRVLQGLKYGLFATGAATFIAAIERGATGLEEPTRVCLLYLTA